MQFVFQSLAWGFLLVLLPLLIHLINLLRYRRQRWAAMQFLLESYRRHKRWVWLKQALLLLTRMAVLAVLVAMLAQWVSGAKLLALLGQNVTHHYVLLDDSMSMSQSFSDGNLYQRGLRSISSILDRSLQDGGSHQVTLVRFSRAVARKKSADTMVDSPVGKPDSSEQITIASQSIHADEVADLMSRTIIGKSDGLLNIVQSQGPVDVDVNGEAACELIGSLLTSHKGGESPIVYLVSDFRQKEWNQPATMKSALEVIENAGARIELLDCSDQIVENISLVSLEPDQEVLASGVPVMLRLTIRNQGLSPVRNLSVRITAYDFGSDQLNIAFDQFSSGAPTELPAITIENIEPGESIVRGLQVVFPRSGSHVVSAAVNEDSLQSDNRVACVLNLVDSQRLLIIDDSVDRTAAQYLQAAIAPSGEVRTGWQIQIESSAFLRDSQSDVLENFAAMFMVDAMNLDERAVRNLRTFVAAGGGLAIFPGKSWTDADAIRISQQLMRGEPTAALGAVATSERFLPQQFASVMSLKGDASDDSISQRVIPENHAVFAPLLSLAASPFQFVRFEKYVSLVTPEANQLSGAATEINSPSTSQGRVMAALGNRAPLLLDHEFGQGRLVMATSAIDPAWNNWPQDPSFVVVMLKLTGFLASFRRSPTSHSVDEEVRYSFSALDFLPEAELVYAAGGLSTRQSAQLTATSASDRELQIAWQPMRSIDAAAQQRALFAGVRELWLSSLAKGRQVINFPANAPAREGELQGVDKVELLESLRPIQVRYRAADIAAEANPFSTASTQQNWLLGLLIFLMLAEQALAYSASYHFPKTGMAAGAAA